MSEFHIINIAAALTLWSPVEMICWFVETSTVSFLSDQTVFTQLVEKNKQKNNSGCYGSRLVSNLPVGMF